LKSVFLEKIGGPLTIKEVPEPEPGDEWVLVKIMRTGVCYRDILTVEGFFPRVTLPIVLGHEIAGIVVDKGCKVDEVDINDKVVALPYISCGECEYCSSGRENLCKNRRWYGEVLNGSYSDHVLVHKNSIVKMDPEVDWNYAAISSCVIGMVIHALDELGDIDEGMKVLVTGAGGGVGIHAIQVAKAYGTEVVAVTSSEDKVDFIRQLNPDHIIVSRGDFSKEVKKTVGPVDIVVEAVGEPTFHSSLRSLKWGGRMAVIGNVNVKPASLPLGLIILRENLIHGVISSTKKSLRKALEMGNKGLVKAIGMEMSLWDVEKAHEILRQKRARGRVFLRP